jgi:hypothetical protein
MHYDEIPKLPEPLPYQIKEEELLFEEFLHSKSRFILFEAEDGDPRLRFDKLDGLAYANYVAVLSAPHNKKAYEFLKLVLEGTRLIKQENKK